MGMSFPNEPQEYRSARDALLQREAALRREMEAVATARRALPPGGPVPEDYVLERLGPDGVEEVRLSELFGTGDTLIVYHFMFPRHSSDTRPGPTSGALSDAPLAEGPCPSCTGLIDQWDAAMPHFEALGGNLVVVARAPISQVAAFARDRGWRNIKLVSAGTSRFRRDYGGDGPDGETVPIMTVFRRSPDGTIRLFWASELIHEPSDPGQDPRHLGTVEPVWTLFDFTPGGRPDREEQLDYGCCHT